MDRSLSTATLTSAHQTVGGDVPTENLERHASPERTTNVGEAAVASNTSRELLEVKQQQAAAREQLRLLKKQEVLLLAMMADAAVAEAAAATEVGGAGGEDDSSLLGRRLQADDSTMTTAACSRLLLERKEQVQDFFAFASDREKLRENLDAGASGDADTQALLPGMHSFTAKSRHIMLTGVPIQRRKGSKHWRLQP